MDKFLPELPRDAEDDPLLPPAVSGNGTAEYLETLLVPQMHAFSDYLLAPSIRAEREH